MPSAFAIDRSLYPFVSRYFDGCHGTMHYIDEGTGPPIVFFHGNPTWSFLYRNVIRRLRDSFRCVAVDYLGFGLSDHPDGFGYTALEHVTAVTELLDHLDLAEFIVVGHDWGGPIGMAVATARHDRVRGIVLSNTWLWPAEHLRLRLFGAIAGTRAAQYLMLQHNLVVEAMRYATTRRLDSAILHHYRSVLPTPASRRGVAELPREITAARPLLAGLSRDVPTLLGSRPALILWGMKDPAFPAADTLDRLAAMFDDTVVVRLPYASHFIQEDAADEIARAIIRRYHGMR